MIVSPGDAVVLSGTTLSCVDVIGAANAGTAVASIAKTMTKQSSRDVIRLFMTKLLLKNIFAGRPYTHRISGSRLVPKTAAQISLRFIFLNLCLRPHMAYREETLVLRHFEP